MKYLITGGAGFIGTHLATALLEKNADVTIFDNLSRKGTEINLKHLKKNFPKLKFIKGDLRSFSTLYKALKNIEVVYHLAGQVAVTTSVLNPREDFEINLLGTFNLLEAIRKHNSKPILIFSSTNKVYGDLEGLKIVETKTRYEFKDLKRGVSEIQNLDFHSPYGCSKGAADQYVRDYSRIYDIPTVVFRQSCIYGPHQFGIEDQGWLAWFVISGLMNRPITIYGNGKQTRDALYVDDLVSAFLTTTKKIKKTKGQIYNIGGGIKNTISVWGDFEKILKRMDFNINASFSNWRPGDQKIFVSDNTKALEDFGWKPTTDLEVGLKKMTYWIRENRQLVAKVLNF